MPMRRILSFCSARAASGHAAAAPPRSVMKSRRLPRNSIQKIPVESMTAVSSMRVRAAHGNSFEQLIGANEQRQWNVKPNRLRGRKVDHQLELGRQDDGQVGGAGAFENRTGVNAG